VFGIFAANHLTELIWAAAGVLLLVLALLPRVGGHGDVDAGSRGAVRTRRVVQTEPQTTTVSGAGREPTYEAGARRTTTQNHESR
jgi:hypothetical protein